MTDALAKLATLAQASADALDAATKQAHQHRRIIRRLLRAVENNGGLPGDHGCRMCFGDDVIGPDDGFKCAVHAAREIAECP
jgi:hypothetical protein